MSGRLRFPASGTVKNGMKQKSRVQEFQVSYDSVREELGQVNRTRRSFPQKMQSSESPGGNLPLLTSCSAPFSRACGRHATAVYSGRGADIVMQSLEFHCQSSRKLSKLPRPFCLSRHKKLGDKRLQFLFLFRVSR